MVPGKPEAGKLTGERERVRSISSLLESPPPPDVDALSRD